MGRNKRMVRMSLMVILGLFSYALQAQIVTNAQSDFIALRSYSGIEKRDAFGFRVHVYGSGIVLPNWSVSVRVNQPIQNADGKIMDPAKLRIRTYSVQGAGFSMQNIGAHDAAIPLAMQLVPILQQAQKPIASGANDYNQLFISFNILIEGGAYLETLKSWSEYPLNLSFLLLDQQGNIVSEVAQGLRMQIYPEDTLPTEPTYAIQLNANARSGTLEFKTIYDYVQGVSQTYPNGLLITSNTPYAIQVRTMTPNFESGSRVIPVDAVSLSLQDPNSALQGTIFLSDQFQTVLNAINSNTQPRPFDIRYFTQPNDERFLKIQPDQYSTVILYSLVPQ